jgi:deoxyribose-phosphate aldolase
MPPSPTTRSSVGSRDWHEIARLIDHTLLKLGTTRSQVTRLCQEALHYGFAAVCVHPSHVGSAIALLRGTGVKVDAPIGFPQGAHLTTVKRFEALEALRQGAQELDMVMNIGELRFGDCRFVEFDIRAVVQVAHDAGALVKVILETPLLSRGEKVLACELSVSAGADFVKTATGLAGGATVDDVALMRSVVGKRARVKASGGIRTAPDVYAMIQAGADRIGTSTSVAIMGELGAPEIKA